MDLQNEKENIRLMNIKIDNLELLKEFTKCTFLDTRDFYSLWKVQNYKKQIDYTKYQVKKRENAINLLNEYNLLN